MNAFSWNGLIKYNVIQLFSALIFCNNNFDLLLFIISIHASKRQMYTLTMGKVVKFTFES